MGLGAWAAGLGVLGLYLAPDGRAAELAVAAVGGLAVAAAGAWLLLRWPWALAFATLACVPIRLPVDVGNEDANLLLPLYLVVGAYAASLGWQLLRGESRRHELGPMTWPLAAVVAWLGLGLLWSDDLREGAIFLAAFVLPFGLLALGFARLPWQRKPLLALYAGLVATALVYAGVGLYQWATREVFWNPKLISRQRVRPVFPRQLGLLGPVDLWPLSRRRILATLALLLLGLSDRLSHPRSSPWPRSGPACSSPSPSRASSP